MYDATFRQPAADYPKINGLAFTLTGTPATAAAPAAAPAALPYIVTDSAGPAGVTAALAFPVTINQALNYGGGLEGYEVGTPAKIENLERVTQKLVAPPFLPGHEQVAEGEPKILQVRMVIEEIRDRDRTWCLYVGFYF